MIKHLQLMGLIFLGCFIASTVIAASSVIVKKPLETRCYRCIKPRKYGFHLYPRLVDRSTCNPKTADYLRSMGYRCYHPVAGCVNTHD